MSSDPRSQSYPTVTWNTVLIAETRTNAVTEAITPTVVIRGDQSIRDAPYEYVRTGSSSSERRHEPKLAAAERAAVVDEHLPAVLARDPLQEVEVGFPSAAVRESGCGHERHSGATGATSPCSLTARLCSALHSSSATNAAMSVKGKMPSSIFRDRSRLSWNTGLKSGVSLVSVCSCCNRAFRSARQVIVPTPHSP